MHVFVTDANPELPEDYVVCVDFQPVTSKRDAGLGR
jgi:hypothetical protein